MKSSSNSFDAVLHLQWAVTTGITVDIQFNWGNKGQQLRYNIVQCYTPALEVWADRAVCCTHMNPIVPKELRRTLGFLTKKPCILWEDSMRPQPFVSLGAASNSCLKLTSTQHQNKSLDPINYRVYQIFCKCLHLIVMLIYTLLALVAGL